MGKTVPGMTPPTDQPSSAERLESWKEIAAYLKRDVRTVQRWEKSEGLAVHRHVHHSLGTVYAYKSELDAWWNNRRPRLEQEEEVLPSSRRRLWWALAVLSVIVVAASIALWRARRSPPLAFQEREWVLIANFENRTGEAVFDGTLEYALERELSNSTFVNVVPRERVGDALRLMRKPPDAHIDAVLGREICLRDGGIRALLTGRVEKLDTTYALSAAVVNPTDGVTVRSLSEAAAGQKELLPALRRLANRVREKLGEELPLIQRTDQALEKATTPSLRALHVYSRGMALVNQQKWQQAGALLEEAVNEDPQFASAHIYLAHCYSNLEKDKEAAPHYRRAFELADTTSDRERYFILGSYYQKHVKDQVKAIAAYEVLVRLYPDDYWGMNNLAFAYERDGRWEDAAELFGHRADIRPRHFLVNFQAERHLGLLGHSAEAQRYLARAQALVTPEVQKLYPRQTIEVEFAPAEKYLRNGDAEKALREADRLGQTFNARISESRDEFAWNEGLLYLGLGKLKAAEDWYQKASKEERYFGFVLIAEARGDRAATRRALLSLLRQFPNSPYLGPGNAARLARLGLLRESQKVVSSIERGSDYYAPHLQFARGALAFAQGRRSEGISRLRNAVEAFKHLQGYAAMTGDWLATALEQMGDLSGAVQVLQSLEQDHLLDLHMGARFRLTQLYRKVGRIEDAQKIEADLLKRLAYGDPDYPILVQLKASQQAALSTSPR